MKRGDFVVYALEIEILFGRVSAINGKLLTIIPTNKRFNTIKRVVSDVISEEKLKEHLTSLNKISIM